MMRLTIPAPRLALRRPAVGWPLALLLTLPALWPLFRPGFFVSDDGLFHVYRIAALAGAWRQGVLYPRLFPEFGFGYGQAVLNFYAPLSYWPGALLALLGVSPAVAAEWTIALGFLLAALAMYGFARHLWGPVGGLLAALAYTYFPYHLADAYIRGAVPEQVAFVWPPLILWAYTIAFGVHRCADESPPSAAAGAGETPPDTGPRAGETPSGAAVRAGETPPSAAARAGETPSGAAARAAWLWAALAWAGLVYTHNLTALMFAPVALVYLLVLAAWTGSWRRLLPAGGSLALAVALSAPLWLPFLAESRAVGIGLGPSDGYQMHLAPVVQLIQWLPFYRYASQPGSFAAHPLSWLAVLLCLACVLLASFRLAARRHVPAWPVLAFGLGLALVSAFLVTAPSLPVWQALRPVLAQLQYPWRFLALTALGLAVVAGAMPVLVPTRTLPLAAGALAVLLICVPLLRLSPTALDVPAAEAWAPDRMWREDAAAGQVGATWTGEFMPLTVLEQRWALGRAPAQAVDGPAQTPRPQVRLERLGYASADVTTHSDAPGALRLHQFYLPGWVATVDGQPAVSYPSGELGLVTVDVAAGEHLVTLRFGPTPARTAGALLAALGVLIWAVLAWRVSRDAGPGGRWLRAAAVGLIAAALILGLNRFGYGQRTWVPQGVHAAVGDVALLVGYDVAPAPGEAGSVDVTLYWYALRDVADNYKAFVHLLGPSGQVLAQHDGDPGGGYTPTTRWRLGELIPDRHRLALPLGASGTLRLWAGMYRFDTLQNLPTDPPASDNRVNLGSIELPLAGGAP